MAFLNYEYRMKIGYAEPVDKCYFTIKAIPADDMRQKNISYELSISPPARYSESIDSFGNRQIYGCENQKHREFDFVIKGLVETKDEIVCGAAPLHKVGIYKYPYGKCIPGAGISAFAKELKGIMDPYMTDKEKAEIIMEKLAKKMTYESGATDVETTAEVAFAFQKGVCQDYAHIFICLLRLLNIPARYVCGLIVGEGKSHAWVEALCEGGFIGFDPTCNKLINSEYIKLGVGRDATDCSINRGVMWGGGTQSQEINVVVSKYY